MRKGSAAKREVVLWGKRLFSNGTCLFYFICQQKLRTCMCKASSGCSPIRPSVMMTRFPASLDVWEDREEDEWRMEPWRFRGLRGRQNGREHETILFTFCRYNCYSNGTLKVTDLCLCMRRTLSGLMWLWDGRIPLGELTPWDPAGPNRSPPGTPCWDPKIYCSEY